MTSSSSSRECVVGGREPIPRIGYHDKLYGTCTVQSKCSRLQYFKTARCPATVPFLVLAYKSSKGARTRKTPKNPERKIRGKVEQREYPKKSKCRDLEIKIKNLKIKITMIPTNLKKPFGNPDQKLIGIPSSALLNPDHVIRIHQGSRDLDFVDLAELQWEFKKLLTQVNTDPITVCLLPRWTFSISISISARRRPTHAQSA